MQFQSTLFALEASETAPLAPERRVLSHGAWVDVQRSWLGEADDVFRTMASEISEFSSLTLAAIGDAGIPFIQTSTPLAASWWPRGSIRTQSSCPARIAGFLRRKFSTRASAICSPCATRVT